MSSHENLRRTISILFLCTSMRLCGHFSLRVLDLINAPLLDVRNDCAKRAKIQRKCTNDDPQKMKQFHQPLTPIERVMLRKRMLVIVELLTACCKSARSPIFMRCLAILSHCCQRRVVKVQDIPQFWGQKNAPPPKFAWLA